ncbi:hypothetical protein [Mariniblastus fucicola]|uniref:hypothetical protein n=1 Tax=Mariniblastus fucicola TaxID=980251 RepID=UPI0009468307|nr:hypothetical protein [Mariniblastus fucicola]
MRILLTVFTAFITLLMLGCEHSVSMTTLDQTARHIFDGAIPIEDNGKCAIDAKNNIIDDTAYITTQSNGDKLILFRTWQGKGANLRGVLYTDAAQLVVGSEIELVTFRPTGPDGGLPIGRADISIDAKLAKSTYRVSRSLD